MEDVINKRVWSTKQLGMALFAAISITFSATMIWSRFVFNEEQIHVLSDRLEKKTKRIEEDNLNQWKMINKLLEKDK